MLVETSKFIIIIFHQIYLNQLVYKCFPKITSNFMKCVLQQITKILLQSSKKFYIVEKKANVGTKWVMSIQQRHIPKFTKTYFVVCPYVRFFNKIGFILKKWYKKRIVFMIFLLLYSTKTPFEGRQVFGLLFSIFTGSI